MAERTPKGKTSNSPAPAGKLPGDPMEEALFREVEEDLREEQLKRFWQQFGSYIIATAVLIVVVVAGYQGWTAWQSHQRAEAASAYEQALRADQEQAAAILETVAREQSSTGYGAIAALNRAALLLDQGQTEQALAAYQEIYGSSRYDSVLRDVARVLFAYNALDSHPADAVLLAIAPLDTPTGAFRHSAQEIQALLALKAGETDQARSRLAALAEDADAPAGVRERARDLRALLGGQE